MRLGTGGTFWYREHCAIVLRQLRDTPGEKAVLERCAQQSKASGKVLKACWGLRQRTHSKARQQLRSYGLRPLAMFTGAWRRLPRGVASRATPARCASLPLATCSGVSVVVRAPAIARVETFAPALSRFPTQCDYYH
jgi:hypothetical protein